jgi:hypothetical protein
MTRSPSYVVAAVLMVLFCSGRAVVEFPYLARGAAGNVGLFGESDPGPPYFLVVANFVIAVLGFVSAYGVWRVEKWGMVLTISLCVLGVLAQLPALLFVPFPGRMVALLFIVLAATIIVLLLRPTSRPAVADASRSV